MNLVDSQLFDIFGKLISCIVSSIITFQYFDKRYFRIYHSKIIYLGLWAVCCIVNFVICLQNNPALNLSFWLIMVTLAGRFFYYDENTSKKKYYLINIAFIFAYSVCESVGIVMLKSYGSFMEIKQEGAIISFINAVSGSVTAILFYYLVLQRIFLGDKIKRILVRQYSIYVVISACTLLNIGQILFMTKYELGYKECIFLVLDGVFIIFLNLYLLNVLVTLAENRELKYKLDLYERQTKSNYEYYMRQMESRKTILSVLHDIEKHINVLHELKQTKEQEEVEKYKDMFEDMIAPLMSGQYCSNAILNVIINDKMDYCRKNGIRFEIDIQEVQMEFMESVDITTVFGNILDNAVAACEKSEEKQIKLKIFPFNGFIFAQLSNTFAGEIIWDGKGRPVSQKGDRHGIGLENVEKILKEYCGEIQFRVEKDVFMLEIMFNHP